MKSRENINDITFLKILPLIIIGIVIGNRLSINISVLLCLSALLMTASFLFRKRSIGSLFISMLISVFAMLISTISSTKEFIPKSEKTICLTSIESTPTTRGRWQQCNARITLFTPVASETWHKTDERIILYLDTCISAKAGDMMFIETYLNPFSTTPSSGYANLMHRRGFSGACYVSSKDNIRKLNSTDNNLHIISSKIQTHFIERFQRLSLSEKAEAVCLAMTFGNRQYLSSADKKHYARSGAAHILAVSGLHVGIVALVVNCLLFFLPFIRRGHLIKNIVAIVIILFFAFMAGLSPSVLRASLMFCGFQLSLLTSSHYNKINILLATASIMLLANPNYLYDTSFQLSFIAVTGIIIFYRPVYSLIKCRIPIINRLNGLAIVSIIATLVTAPIIAAQFGRLTLIGIVINPIIMLTATIIVSLSFFYALFPILTTPIGFILEKTASFQNNLTEFCSNLSWGSWEVELSATNTIIIYLFIILCLFAIIKIKNNKIEKLNI